MIGGRGLDHPQKEELRPEFRRQKGKNLSKTKRQGPRGPTIPAGGFLSIEKWPRQRAATDREVWTKRQAAEPGGKEGAWRETGKQRDKQRARQTKGPSARDRQTGERKLTEGGTGTACPRLHACEGPSLSLSVRVSAGMCLSGPLGLFAHCVQIYPFSWEFVLSSGLSTPCPLPVSLPVCAPSQLLLLSQAISLPFTLSLREMQTFPVGFGRLPQEPGQSTRDGQEGQGLQFRGQLLACRREKAVQYSVPTSGQA